MSSIPLGRKSDQIRERGPSTARILSTSTESLPAENRETPNDCFYKSFRLTLRLSTIVSG
jgi:hypothetical protein